MKALLLALFVAGCSAAIPTPAPTPITHTITGTLTLQSASNWGGVPGTPGRCQGTGGYADVKEGQTVIIEDQTHTVIATTATTWKAVTANNDCQYGFSTIVPDATFYSVEVGHRGAVTNSKADMESKGWHVELTLGQ